MPVNLRVIAGTAVFLAATGGFDYHEREHSFIIRGVRFFLTEQERPRKLLTVSLTITQTRVRDRHGEAKISCNSSIFFQERSFGKAKTTEAEKERRTLVDNLFSATYEELPRLALFVPRAKVTPR